MKSINKPGAFTLVEMLVVIAVIAILASMLLPAVARGRQKALQTNCASNLKQAGAAIQMFADDNQDTLPGPVWAGAMASYDINSSQELIWYIAVNMGLPAPSARTYVAKAFVCPSYESEAPGLTSLVGRKVYFLNPDLDPNPLNSVPPFGNPGKSPPVQPLKMGAFDSYTSPSAIWAISDVDQALPSLNPTVSWWSDLPRQPVHGAVRNQVFFDWHVQAVRW